MYEVDFIGAGWSYPLGADPSGRVALVTREREIEQSIRLILGTSIGERPMRPDFGCRIHDHVFGPANSATAGQIAYDVRDALERWETRIDITDVQGQLRSDQRGPRLHRHRLLGPRAERPAQPRLPVLRDPRRGRSHPAGRRSDSARPGCCRPRHDRTPGAGGVRVLPPSHAVIVVGDRPRPHRRSVTCSPPRTWTTDAFRTWSTTPSGWSSSVARPGPITTCPIPGSP